MDNFLTSIGLNRFSEFRNNENWLKEKLECSQSKIIITNNFNPLINDDEIPKAVLLSFEEIKKISLEFSRMSFLGELKGENYFIADVSDLNKSYIEKITSLGSFMDFRRIMNSLSPDEASLLAYTRALTYWQSRNKFCGKCGSRTKLMDAGHKIICTSDDCRSELFPKIDPAVIVLVSAGEKCLLARQKKWPEWQYSTIAGFVEPGESLELAVKREVNEETGINVEEIIYHSSQPWPFPAALMLGFHAKAVNLEIQPRDNELEHVRWFTRKEIIESLENKTLRFPPSISISFKLIEQWFNQSESGNLKAIIDKFL